MVLPLERVKQTGDRKTCVANSAGIAITAFFSHLYAFSIRIACLSVFLAGGKTTNNADNYLSDMLIAKFYSCYGKNGNFHMWRCTWNLSNFGSKLKYLKLKALLLKCQSFIQLLVIIAPKRQTSIIS